MILDVTTEVVVAVVTVVGGVAAMLGSFGVGARFVFTLAAEVQRGSAEIQRLASDVKRLSSETVKQALYERDIERIDGDVEAKASRESVETLTKLVERVDHKLDRLLDIKGAGRNESE